MPGGRSRRARLDMENRRCSMSRTTGPLRRPLHNHREERDPMKYMLLLFNNPQKLEAAGHDMERIGREVEELMTELNESGEWIGGEALAHPDRAKTVRVRDGAPVVTDGPFAEAKEQFAGYCLLDCESDER